MKKTEYMIILLTSATIFFCGTTKPVMADQNRLYYVLNSSNDDTGNISTTTDAENETDGAVSQNPEDEKSIFSLKGYLKNLSSSIKTDTYSKTLKEKYLNSNLTRLRLTPQLNFSDLLSVYADFDNEIITGNYLKSYEFNYQWRPTGYDDFLKLSREPYYTDRYFYRAKIHSAYAKLVTGDLTLSLGRQQIRFGSGRLWNPLDILNPVSPTGIEGAEEQKGTDALRAEYFIGKTSDISVVIDPKRKKDNISYGDISTETTNLFARFKTNLMQTDFAVLGGLVTDRNVYGIDISSIVMDGTLRGSVINVKPRKIENGKSYIQSSAGYEYTFSSGLYFLMEYFYNQNGMNSNPDLKTAYQWSLFTGINETNYYLLSNQLLTYNSHYLGAALGYDITPIARFEIFFIYDLQGKALFFNPTIKCNALQNLDISLSLMKAYISEDSDKDSDFFLVKNHPMFYASVQSYF